MPSKVAASLRSLAAGATLAILTTTTASAAIVANLEVPSASELMSGIGNVQGWAFPTLPGDEIDPLIDVYIDGQFALQVPCCSDRADVKQAYPAAPVLSGFSGAFNYQSLTPGQHTLEVHVYSNLGDHKVLTTSFDSDAIGSYPFNKSFKWGDDDADPDNCYGQNTVVGGQQVAKLICTDFKVKNSAGYTEHCAGNVEFTWMPSSQGFRLTKGCDLIDWSKPPFSIEIWP